MERSSADSMIAAYARHADRRVRCHLAIEADLALVHVRRLRELHTLLGAGPHLDDHRSGRALLGPLVRQRQSGAIAEKADALADRTDVDPAHGGLPHIGAAQDLGHPRGADGIASRRHPRH